MRGVALLLVGAAAQSDLSFQQHFCALRDGLIASVDGHLAEWDAQVEVVRDLPCEKVMEFIYLSRERIREELMYLVGNYTEQEEKTRAQPEAGVPALMSYASRAASLLSAHSHISSALLHLRRPCLTEHIRLLFMVSLRRLKAVLEMEHRQLWYVFQGTLPELRRTTLDWLREAAQLFEADVRTMASVMSVYVEPEEPEKYLTIDEEGRTTTLERLGEETFAKPWRSGPLDRAILRYVLELDARVVEFGAGRGQRAAWLNDTGLVAGCWALDTSPDVGLVTRGAVMEVAIDKPEAEIPLGPFDWVMALDVHKMLPDARSSLLTHVAKTAVRGAVVSWGSSDGPSAMPEAEAAAALGGLPLVVDVKATDSLRAAAPGTPVWVLRVSGTAEAQSIGDIVGKVPARASALDGCGIEEGAMYGGADVMTYNDVPEPKVCCKLCSQHPSCTYWTWSNDAANQNMCWLKSTREHRVPHPKFVSGRSQ